MPIFEFMCDECSKPFEELVRSSTGVDEVICPTCGSRKVKKKISTFASKISSGGASFSFNPSPSSCGTGST